ncbi:hypothetical protein P167DRAFT_561665 [Morchella conica CCBAS932]|uniref:Stress-response A/B barrel domain-containing protein n=1 Tax=Morchella conica CCBAS932 TaxID=1392247 RepID=A0A3N4L3C6_9PEZI|nr:hypothetical protein P167DRAFT_561665 [Morchella conica CCBAS932]
MTITHIVMLKYPEGTSEATIKQTLDDAIALKSTCLHPKTGKPYMLSVKAGRDNSPEGIQNGFTHLFVMEFENAEDRDYYVAKDPVHQVYVKMLGALPIGAVMVMDFEGGCY